MEFRWRFDLTNSTNNYLREIANSAGYDVTIYSESNDYEEWLNFTSFHLNELDDPNLIFERAYKLKLLVDGFSFIIHENKKAYSPIVLGNLYDENERVIVFDKFIRSRRFDFSYSADPKDEVYKSNALSHLIRLGAEESFVRNILLMCSTGMDFISLYRVLDEVKTYLKGKEKVENLVDKTKLKSFTHTANNFQVLGIDARHGTQSDDPPKCPMTLIEAQNLISELIRKVSSKYLNVDLPFVKDYRISADDLF